MLQGYLELKLSWQLFQKAPETLSEPERSRLLEVARKQNSIEQRILGSAEAANVVIPANTLAMRVDEVRKRGIAPPLLVRFPDILGQRLGKLQAAFGQAQQDWEYSGGYTAVYPIKVNQTRGVAGTLASHHGEGFGLEAGSKPELIAVLALSRNLIAWRATVHAGRWQQSDQFCLFDHPIRDLHGATLGLIGGNVMHLEMSLDQMLLWRPLPELAGYRVPGAPGLYLTGASTHPGGGVTGKAGDKLVDLWNAGKLPRLLVHPASMGHGLNMQEGHARHVVLHSLIDSYDDYDQLVRRVRRSGNKAASVTVHRIIAKDTVDEAIIGRNETKESRQQTFFEAIREYTIRRHGKKRLGLLPKP